MILNAVLPRESRHLPQGFEKRLGGTWMNTAVVSDLPMKRRARHTENVQDSAEG